MHLLRCRDNRIVINIYISYANIKIYIALDKIRKFTIMIDLASIITLICLSSRKINFNFVNNKFLFV